MAMYMTVSTMNILKRSSRVNGPLDKEMHGHRYYVKSCQLALPI